MFRNFCHVRIMKIYEYSAFVYICQYKAKHFQEKADDDGTFLCFY